MKTWLIMIVLSTLSFIDRGAIAEGITFHKLLRPHRVEQDASGDYDRVIDAILAEAQTKISVQYSPIMRVHRALLQENNVCAAPGNLDVFITFYPDINKLDYITGTPIDMVSGHLVSKSGKPVVRSFDDLAGKRIAVWWGVPAEQYIANTNVEIVSVTDENHAIKLLMAGRVDLAWGWIPDSMMHYKQLGHELPNFDPDFALMAAPISFVCKRSAETQMFLKEVDAIVETMRNDGRLKKLFSPHARIIGIDVPWSVIEP